jgi:hypothetical protein
MPPSNDLRSCLPEARDRSDLDFIIAKTLKTAILNVALNNLKVDESQFASYPCGVEF